MHLIKLTAETWLSWDGEEHSETWDPETALTYTFRRNAELMMGMVPFCQQFPHREVVEHA